MRQNFRKCQQLYGIIRDIAEKIPNYIVFLYYNFYNYWNIGTL